MKLLAFDTSGDILSLALFDGERLLGEYRSALFTRHSSSLAPAIEKLLKKARIPAAKLDFIAVGLGPGSFTGLRVGLTTAKFLAYASGAKIVAVPSLEIIAARSAKKGSAVVVSRDAKKGRVYGAVYACDAQGALKTLQKPVLTDAARFAADLPAGAVHSPQNSTPDAADLAKLARPMIRKKKFTDAAKLEPLYLHPRDCNVTLPKKEAAHA